MLKAYKFRIYPTDEQKVLIHKHMGACRYIYNWALATKIKAWKEENKSLSRFTLQKELPIMKKNPETSWLSEINSQSLQSALDHLDKAYVRFFREKKGFPKFKSKKDNRQSFQCPQSVEIINGKLELPKFKKSIEIVLHRKFSGEIRTCTISKTPTNKYFISILIEDKKELPKNKRVKKDKTLGIDLGLKDFLIDSNGNKVEHPKWYKQYENRLTREQKRLSKKVKGSSNRNKQRIKLARVYEKIRNKKLDFLHKISSSIVNDNQVDSICVEDLAVSNMIKNHKLARSISDSNWSEFINLLKYKCEWSGKNFIQIGRFDASSKICNVCGLIKTDLKLSDREWVCESCKTMHDRDINAALNIRDIGISRVGMTQTQKPIEKTGNKQSR